MFNIIITNVIKIPRLLITLKPGVEFFFKISFKRSDFRFKY